MDESYRGGFDAGEEVGGTDPATAAEWYFGQRFLP